MDRRRFLVAGMAGTSMLAGCLGHSPGTATSTATSTGTHPTGGTRTSTETRSGQRDSRVVSGANAGTFETGRITGSVELVTSKITTGHTAELALSLHNTSSESVTLSYTLPRGLDLMTGTRSNGDAHLLLVGEDIDWERTDGCWQPDGRVLARGMPDQRASLTLDGNETQERSYRLWNHPETTGCLPRGTYEFARTFHRNGSESTWQFDLSLSG